MSLKQLAELLFSNLPKFRKRHYVLDVDGFCPICDEEVRFYSEHEWLRDHFLCSKCGSIPRERALMHIIKMHYPNYKTLQIHESSPSNRGASEKLRTESTFYSFSHYFENIPLGECHPELGHRCENLERLTFPDNTFDLFISQDVMEHILDPAIAFKEIARVIRPGGAHIFTVPVVNKGNSSECMASRDEKGGIIFHQEPEYHDSPTDKSGSLVTMHWGYDITDYIIESADTPSEIILIDNIRMGIRAEYLEVVVSRKY